MTTLRRRRSFSLRTLFVMVSVLSLLCAYFGRGIVNTARRESALKSLHWPNAIFEKAGAGSLTVGEPWRDEAVATIRLRPHAFTAEEQASLSSLFLEATVECDQDYFEWLDGRARWKPGEPIPQRPYPKDLPADQADQP